MTTPDGLAPAAASSEDDRMAMPAAGVRTWNTLIRDRERADGPVRLDFGVRGPVDPRVTHAAAIFLGCRPSQRSHESPSCPLLRALSYWRAISWRCLRQQVASRVMISLLSRWQISHQMRRKCGSSWTRFISNSFQTATTGPGCIFGSGREKGHSRKTDGSAQRLRFM